MNPTTHARPTMSSGEAAVPARPASASRRLALALLLVAGCKSAPPAKPAGVLWLNLKPPSATVLLDEQPVVARPGAVTLRIAVRPGAHRLELRAPGHFTAYRDLDIASAGEVRIDLALRPDPDAEPQSDAPARLPGPLPPKLPELP